MKAIIYLLIFFISLPSLNAQFLHPTTGINNENVGSCLTSTCGGTYLDDGGAGGSYSNSINLTYRVFCPNTAGNCVRLTFTSFSMEGMVNPAGPPPLDCYYDYLTVGNGPTQNSAPIIQRPPSSPDLGATTGRICGTPTVPFSYTSTDASGCLSLRFTSDASVDGPGWSANISCVPCAGGPTGTANNDCNNSTALCSNVPVSSISTGPGIKAEGCTVGTCPAGGENFTNWYEVLIATSGTFMFTVTPSPIGQDYDFFVFGPNPSCAALGAPIRCNDSGTTGQTGLSASGVNPVEPVTGSVWCTPLNVLAGERYYIVVDSWSPPTGNYSMNFGGTATFNCAVLPVEMISFTANYNMALKQSELIWVTAIENNISHYSIERSTDAVNYKEINKVYPTTQNSNSTKNYFYADQNPVNNEINYYRIITVDNDGRTSISNLQAVAFQDDNANLSLIPNPAKEAVELTFKSNLNQFWDISFYDSKGIIKKQSNYSAQTSGTNKYSIDLSGLNRGMYFVVINNGLQQYKRKLIVE